MVRVTEGGEYRGETYICCDSHETTGRNDGWGTGAIFEGQSREALVAFLAEHADCP